MAGQNVMMTVTRWFNHSKTGQRTWQSISQASKCLRSKSDWTTWDKAEEQWCMRCCCHVGFNLCETMFGWVFWIKEHPNTKTQLVKLMSLFMFYRENTRACSQVSHKPRRNTVCHCLNWHLYGEANTNEQLTEPLHDTSAVTFSVDIMRPTWAAKARPAVFKTDHPGTAVKMPVSLTRSVQRKHIKSEGEYRDRTYTVWKGLLYTYRGRWPFTSKPTNAFCLFLPLVALNSSSPKVSFQLCFWVEIPDELTQNMAFKSLTAEQKPKVKHSGCLAILTQQTTQIQKKTSFW